MRTSLNQFQQPVRTSLSQSQPVSTTRRNWFELVIASEEPVWASHSQVQFKPSPVTTTLRQSQPVSTPRKNQFEASLSLVTASFNNQEEPVHNQFEPSPLVRTSKLQTSFNSQSEPGRTWFELVTASFNNQEEPVWEPVWASHSQFQQPGGSQLVWTVTASWRTSLSQFQTAHWFSLQPVWASWQPVWHLLLWEPVWTSFNQ